MNGVNGHRRMFDLSCNCFFLEDIDAGLAIFIDWQWTDLLFIEAQKVCHSLKVDPFLILSSYKATLAFAVGGVECNIFLLFGLPIDADIVDANNEIVARSPSTIVPSMITVDSHDKTVQFLHIWQGQS